MTRWTGRMPISALRKGLIRPAEFSTWDAARRYHQAHRRDRKTLEELRASIPQDGIRDPLLLGVRYRDRLVFVFEGHHRAVIALETGVHTFPFQWFQDPDRDAVQSQPFPFHLIGDN